MKAILNTESASDERLVLNSRNGDRDAFARIVERYQSLICALTYGACGDLQTSEDLAQVTFITAWCELPKLQEPSKLKSWLCGIARNVTNSSFRQQRHTPTANAEALDESVDIPSDAPSPRDHVISREEEAILWRALGELPTTYREPLVLFYRQHQSTAEVAEVLGLSEDVVHQRLSRGRTMLTERVAQFVETTLSHTGPTQAFSVGVLAALPLTVTAAKAVLVGAAAGKGGATAKTAGWFGALGAVLTAGVLFMFSFFAFLMFVGGCVGYVMSRASERSSRQLEYVTRFWRALALGTLVFVLPGIHHGAGRENGMPTWLGMIYPLVLAALGLWVWRWWRGLAGPETITKESVRALKRSLFVWLGLGMILPALMFVLFMIAMFQGPLTSERISGEQARRIIAERSDAQFTVEQYKGVPRHLWIKLPENRRRVEFWTPAEPTTLSQLSKSGRNSKSMEFHETALPVRWLALLSLFLVPIGAVILIRRPWRQEFDRQETGAVRQRPERNAARAFAVTVAIALVVAGTFLGLITRWHLRYLTTAEAQKIIAEHPDASVELAQFKNGSSELSITLRGSRNHPDFKAPADESTLSLLTQKGIAYPTYIQGPDFGFADPVPRWSLLCILLLLSGAGLLLWWASKSQTSSPAPASRV
jgi:RNA polymerase sigma factor (sigma-70 family)